MNILQLHEKCKHCKRKVIIIIHESGSDEKIMEDIECDECKNIINFEVPIGWSFYR